MTDKEDKGETIPKITNDEKPEVNTVINKKLTEMSKEAKTRTKKRKLQKPQSPKDDTTTVTTLTNNQMYMLLAIVGVIIAGASLYYQRKSVVKSQKPKVEEVKKEPEPVVEVSTPGMYTF